MKTHAVFGMLALVKRLSIRAKCFRGLACLEKQIDRYTLTPWLQWLIPPGKDLRRICLRGIPSTRQRAQADCAGLHLTGGVRAHARSHSVAATLTLPLPARSHTPDQCWKTSSNRGAHILSRKPGRVASPRAAHPHASRTGHHAKTV